LETSPALIIYGAEAIIFFRSIPILISSCAISAQPLRYRKPNKGNPADRCAPGDFFVNHTSNTGVFPALTETVFVVPVVEDLFYALVVGHPFLTSTPLYRNAPLNITNPAHAVRAFSISKSLLTYMTFPFYYSSVVNR
jgi:hypothetical protein